ncbi:TcmI family type II polyketide cyclase [Geodermatophilus sp. SYSU D00758]
MTFRPFRNVIVCHMVPGSEDKVGPVFAYYDETTRPQDLGVIGRYLCSLEDLYIHVIERKEDPAVSGQRRGLPAFQAIAEQIAPYVTPYPSYWENPSHSVAKPFYQWVPEGDVPEDRELTVIVQRMKPGSEEDIARVFAESDAGDLPVETGVTGRWLFSMEDVFVHLLEQDREKAAAVRAEHEGGKPAPAFAKIMQALSPYVGPYRPETWQSPKDSVARVFHRWQAPDWSPEQEAAPVPAPAEAPDGTPARAGSAS